MSNSKNHHHHKYSHYKGHYNYLKYNNSYSISSTNDNGSDIRKFYKDTEVYFDFKQVVYGSGMNHKINLIAVYQLG